jgi:hypothetical protein
MHNENQCDVVALLGGTVVLFRCCALDTSRFAFREGGGIPTHFELISLIDSHVGFPHKEGTPENRLRLESPMVLAGHCNTSYKIQISQHTVCDETLDACCDRFTCAVILLRHVARQTS